MIPNQGLFSLQESSGNTWRHFLVVTTGRKLPVSSEQKQGLLLTILWHTVQPLTMEDYLIQNVSTAQVEKPWPGVTSNCKQVMFKLYFHFKLPEKGELQVRFIWWWELGHSSACENTACAQDIWPLSPMTVIRKPLLRFKKKKKVTKLVSLTWVQVCKAWVIPYRTPPHSYSDLYPGWYLLFIDWFY